MAYDLADVVPLTVTVRDSAGDPADGGSVVLTIEKPNGSTVTPAVTHAGPGVYQVDYPPVMPGRHVAMWACTGLNASGFTDVFDVRPASPPYLVSLADAKSQLNITSTADDEELRRVIEAATAAVERHIDKAIVRRTVVEQRNLGNASAGSAPGVLQRFALTKKPILSLTSIVSADGGITWNPSDMRGTDSGVVEVLSGAVVWGPVILTYVAGMQVIPAECTESAETIIQHIWENQRGRAGGPRAGGMETSGLGFTSLGYAIPNAALEMLGPSVSGIA